MSEYSFTVYRTDDGSSVRRDGFASIDAAAIDAAASAARSGLEVCFPQRVYRSRVRRVDGETLVERGARRGWRMYLINRGSRGFADAYVFVHPVSVSADEVIAAVRDHLETPDSLSA